MKKLENLGRKLGKAEQKKIMGGPNEGGGDGSCTYTYGGVSCTSDAGVCRILYCQGGGTPGQQYGVCCDGEQYAVGGASSQCTGLGGTLCCDA